MDNLWKWLLLVLLIAGTAWGVVTHPEAVYGFYQAHFAPAEPEPEPVDLGTYIELVPAEDDELIPKGYERGSVVYVAGARDVLGWDETEIALHYTWEGSPETEKQSEIAQVKHGDPVQIIDWRDGRAGRWYRVETMGQFRRRGWIRAVYLVTSKPAAAKDEKEWGKAKEAVEEKRRKQAEEAERQRKLLEEARRRGW